MHKHGDGHQKSWGEQTKFLLQVDKSDRAKYRQKPIFRQEYVLAWDKPRCLWKLGMEEAHFNSMGRGNSEREGVG